MDITIRGRNGQVPEALAEFATQKLQRLGRFLSTITSIEVELYEDSSRKAPNGQVASLIVATTGPVFRSKAASRDPRTSIEIAVERLERRLKEFKRRRSARPAHSRSRVPHAEVSEISREALAEEAEEAEEAVDEGERPTRFEGERPTRFEGERPTRFEGERPTRFEGPGAS